MPTKIDLDCSGVDWIRVAETLKRVGMAHHDPALHQKAFENSAVTVFVHAEGTLAGFGRAISDGAYQSALYDVAVVPEFQNRGIGTTIIGQILDRLPHGNVILYASPGKEAFYEKLGFRRMKTGMALFKRAAEMREKGFTE
ncbi:MAG TPA: GNAT family N-acetyltransferase [Desulfatirhabdiaceae bacterium]|nr:GNAT family N-acetyltransferase [Desulfatirhabdiaceae bacterium]